MLLSSNSKSKFIVLIVYLFTAFIITSCKKYIDKKPDSTLAIPTALSDLQALLDLSLTMNKEQSPSFGEASCDDYFLSDEMYNSKPIEHQMIYTWSRGDYYFQNDWSKAYLPIYVSNYCLEQIDKIPETFQNQLNWNNVKGSALFFRSYNFLNLMWVYAKAYDSSKAGIEPGIVLRYSSDFNLPSKRSNIQECYDQIISDAKESLEYLPDMPIHVMRPSKTASYGLLARCYLSMRAYDSALKYSNLCLELKSDLIDYNGDDDIYGSVTANTPFKQFNKETIFYTEMNGNSYINYPSGVLVDTILYSQYDSTDLRKTAFFRPDGNYYRFKGNYAASNFIYFSGLTTGEMLLTRSECFARKGNIASAIKDLNTLLRKRRNRNLPFHELEAHNFIETLHLVLSERRKELYMRGLRWMDIKRLNKEGANIILKRTIEGKLYYLEPNASYYALPLPTDIIDITGMTQN
ncbi:RagB/SusD family nutrient uptake outer membrane protein [Agriterribacter sp.]|uniref:RagB/SusD family nutrient uptake outer membrane protein n=1 Tax=Agriterribacter sp. TaxID=2821509 RepID=UPI002BEF3E54|nr:RagB/SusD family nutrient uptake outer membrane protein [Agriterribacter sp.]HRP57166.1 RagB/SusD family nutrient uptake outer membrane protein [Agriterribacter sp.]